MAIDVAAAQSAGCTYISYCLWTWFAWHKQRYSLGHAKQAAVAISPSYPLASLSLDVICCTRTHTPSTFSYLFMFETILIKNAHFIREHWKSCLALTMLISRILSNSRHSNWNSLSRIFISFSDYGAATFFPSFRIQFAIYIADGANSTENSFCHGIPFRIRIHHHFKNNTL